MITMCTRQVEDIRTRIHIMGYSGIHALTYDLSCKLPWLCASLMIDTVELHGILRLAGLSYIFSVHMFFHIPCQSLVQLLQSCALMPNPNAPVTLNLIYSVLWLLPIFAVLCNLGCSNMLERLCVYYHTCASPQIHGLLCQSSYKLCPKTFELPPKFSIAI